MTAPLILDELRQPGALRLEFQPIFRFEGEARSVYAFEALTRGPRATSMERPDVLFEYARRKGEESQMDLLCIGLALREAAKLPDAPRISMNIHGSTLSGVPGFAELLLEDAAAAGLAPNRLMLEIVEHRSAWDLKAMRRTLDQLARAGVLIALDDLGVGASNYHMLIDCRPDHLKIDRYIVAGCSRDRYRVAVLRSIVTLGHESEATPIAEGVEDEDDMDVLRSLGIDCVQGWLYAPSLPAEQYVNSPLLSQSFQREKVIR
ncbi:MAG TPA: EAL domain-containing protein [Thermoanaerobaculia bacterium]|nr:EAL domain-containing protein [Thermoanaerobaculia bacterium]